MPAWSLSRSPFSGNIGAAAPVTAGEMCGSVSLLLLLIFFNIVAYDRMNKMENQTQEKQLTFFLFTTEKFDSRKCLFVFVC